MGIAGTEPEYKYVAFISYARAADGLVASEVFEALETYRIPKRIREEARVGKRCGRLFKDADELAAESNLPVAITDALASSKYLIVVCSPEARARPWINWEIEHFIQLGRKDHVLAVLVRGEATDAFPPALVPLDPIAIDLRATTRRARRRQLGVEKLRLLARLIGCEFDALRQRDAQRAVARSRTIAGVAVAVAAVAIAVLIYVLDLRRVSEERRVAAEARLAAASLVLDRLRGLIENEIPAGASSDDLKPLLVSLIGDTRRDLEKTGGTGTYVGQIEMGTHFDQAQMSAQHSDLAGAEREYRAALVIGERELLKQPGNAALRLDIAVTHRRLAALAKRRRDPAQAKAELALALAQTEALVHDEPSNAMARGNLCEQYEARGEQLEADGSPDAKASYEQVVVCAKEVSPDLWVEIGEPLAEAHRRLASLHLQHAEPKAAIDEYREAVKIAEPGADRFPAWFPPKKLVDDYIAIARLLEESGNVPDARRELEKASQFIARFRAANPQSALALDQEWVIRSHILQDAARTGDSAGVAASLSAFLATEQLIENRIETETGELQQYVEEMLELAHRLVVAQAADAGVAVARKALGILNRHARESKSFAGPYLLLTHEAAALMTVLGPDEPLAVPRAEIEACRKLTKLDRDHALRCGFAFLVRARAALARNDLAAVSRDSDAAMALWKQFGEDRTPEVLEFKVGSGALALRLLSAQGGFAAALRLSAQVLPLARERAGSASGAMDKDLANEALADVLLLTGIATLPTTSDQRLALLRESAALWEKDRSALGDISRTACLVQLAKTLFDRQDLAGAKNAMNAARGVLAPHLAAGEPLTQDLVAVFLMVEEETIEVAVAAKNRPICEEAAQQLQKLGELFGDGVARAAVKQLGARCAAIVP